MRDQLAAYIDGELSPREEMDLEGHLIGCVSCNEELNEQKKMLCALDFALVEDETKFELPKNFTKVVVTNAESNVGGLRCPQERFRTLFVCSVLFLLVLLGLGSEMGEVLTAFRQFFGKILAVGGFVAHQVYDITIGAAIILRSVSYQFVHNTVAVLIAGLIVFLLFSIFALPNTSRF